MVGRSTGSVRLESLMDMGSVIFGMHNDDFSYICLNHRFLPLARLRIRLSLSLASDLSDLSCDRLGWQP